MVKVVYPQVCPLNQMEKAMKAVQKKEMSLRQAAQAFGVHKSSRLRRVTEQVPVSAKPGPLPTLTEGEVQGVIDAVDARTNRGLYFTRVKLGMFIRHVVEQSPYTRIIPATFPSTSWVNGFIRRHHAHFGRRSAQNLDVCRAKASTEENVDFYFNNLKQVIDSCHDLPPSRIWNLNETGMCGRGSGRKPEVLAKNGKRANAQNSDLRVNVSALVCGSADGDVLPPFIIFPGKSYNRKHTAGGYPNSKYTSSASSFLVTSLFIQYFEWFVTVIPPERPVLLIMDGYKAHFLVRTLACARANGTLLFALTAHTSHFLQPSDICVFNHFKRALDLEIAAYQKSTSIMVDETNIVVVAAKAFRSTLTRAHYVDGFERAGIYPLSRENMMAGLVGNKPTKRKKNSILLKPTVMISDRTARKIVRSGDDLDRVRVESINHWLMEERKMHKKQKRDIDAQIHERKEAEKTANVREKKAKAQAKVAKAKKKQDKKVAKLVADEMKARNKVAAAAKRAAVAVAKAEAKEASRIAKSEAKEAKRIAKAEAKRIAGAAEKEIKRLAKAEAKEAKRIAQKQQRAAASAEAKEANLIDAVQTNVKGITAQQFPNEQQPIQQPEKRGGATSVFERSDLGLKMITSADFDTKVLHNLTL